MDGWVDGVCVGCGSQDESFAGAAGGWDCASTGAGVAEGYQAGYAYAAVAGTYSCKVSIFGRLTRGCQVVLALPFLPTNARGYLSRSFEFSRQFLYKWTVNWRFVGEEVFLSRNFSTILLVIHLTLLVLFLATRWIKPTGLPLPLFIRSVLQPPPTSTWQRNGLQLSPSFIPTTILSAIAVGMLCARSLHYQFFTYIAWATPFLLWKAGLHPVLLYAVWVAQEWAWNIYPSTNMSSMVVVACLAVQVIGVWWGTRMDSDSLKSARSPERRDHLHVE